MAEQPAHLMLMAVRPALPVVTVTIIAVNVLVYLAMGLSGVSWTEHQHSGRSQMGRRLWSTDVEQRLVARSFTSTFVHFGIIHIGLNMWCLWNLGTTLEPFMGRKVFSVTYVASGLAASLVQRCMGSVACKRRSIWSDFRCGRRTCLLPGFEEDHTPGPRPCARRLEEPRNIYCVQLVVRSGREHRQLRPYGWIGRRPHFGCRDSTHDWRPDRGRSRLSI